MIGLNEYGTRVVQKLIENMTNNNDILYFVHKLEYLIIKFLKSTNAYHIVIRSACKFDDQVMSNIYNIIASNIIGISNNQIGCSAIQKCIDSVPKTVQSKFVEILSKHTVELVFNKYGYFVLCHAVNKRIKTSIKEILEILTNKLDLVKVCTHQQSRVILEKCLEYSDSQTRKCIIDLLKNKQVFDSIIGTDSGIKGKLSIKLSTEKLLKRL